MAQGKLKVKTQVPNSKKVQRVTKRGNSKVFKKHQGSSKKNKLKQALETTLRANIEAEMRARATSSGQTMKTDKGTKSSKGRKA